MITAIKNNSTFRSNYLSMIGAALLGLAIVMISGHVQVNALHDAAHDVRHTDHRGGRDDGHRPGRAADLHSGAAKDRGEEADENRAIQAIGCAKA